MAMLKKSLIVLAVAAGVLAVSGYTHAANPFNFKFPIAELENCSSMEACKVYCDVPANAEACLNFAQKQGIVSKTQAETGKKFQSLIQNGDVPVARCSDENSCKQLCGLRSEEHTSQLQSPDHL